MKIASRVVIVSVFLPLGPLGQGGFGIIQLGKVSMPVFSSYEDTARSHRCWGQTWRYCICDGLDSGACDVGIRDRVAVLRAHEY